MALHSIIIISIFLLANALVYLYMFCEQRLLAKSQQRLGPNRAGWYGFQHVFADYVKAWRRSGFDYMISKGFLPALGFGVTLFLPYLFIVLLLYPVSSVQETFGGFLSLYIVLFFSLVVEDLFLFAFKDAGTRILVKRQEILTLLGATIFLMANMVPILRMESPTLLEMQRVQDTFPYFLMLKSPFVFLASIVSFLSVFYIIPSPPFADIETRTFGGIRQNLFSLTRTLWAIAIMGFWVTLYMGGNVGHEFNILSILAFLFKLSIVSLIFLWARRTFPSMRVSDSVEFGFKRLLPLASVAVLGELIWLALWKL